MAELASLSTSVHPLRIVEPPARESWDDLVLTHPGATVFHSQGWANILQASYGYRPCYILAEASAKLLGLLPLFGVRSPLTGARGVSIPFTDHCPALLSCEISLESLFQQAREIGERHHWRSLELRGTDADFAPPSSTFYEHTLDLSPSETDLFQRCDPAMRRAIRKAEKEGIKVEPCSGPDGMEQYFRLHQLTRQKHGLPPQPLHFFRHIHQFLVQRGFGTVFLARLGSEIIAGAVFLHFGSHAVYKFGASDPRHQDSRPNNLLLWHGLLQMKHKAAQTLSFGRTSIHQEGLRRFKRGFGAIEQEIHYSRYLFGSKQFAPQELDRASGWHATLFRLCPRWLARPIGAILYPHIG